jgi:hypothetical protein
MCTGTSMCRKKSTLPFSLATQPRLSPENRPYVISSKPANGIGRRRDCFTLPQRGFARRGLSR